jgi:Flp pilus assembly protein TadB
MKFLSVFTKAPKHQRFSYTPRFYDPQKEEMEERESRIKLELAREKGEEINEDLTSHRRRISGAFQAARKRNNPVSAGTNATMLRLGILLFMVVFIIAFLEFGRPVLYSLILFVPFYFYLKFKRK